MPPPSTSPSGPPGQSGPSGQSRASGPSGPFRRLAGSFIALGRIRLELLAIEVQEEKDRIVAMLVWAVVTAFLGCFALVFVALFVTIALWDTHRLQALGGFAVLFIALALWGVMRLQQLVGTGPSLFQSTIAELRADSKALNEPPASP